MANSNAPVIIPKIYIVYISTNPKTFITMLKIVVVNEDINKDGNEGNLLCNAKNIMKKNVIKRNGEKYPSTALL